LTLEDEVFVEKSLQRTLIEFDKLIGYSGTPTMVWRRTGEICLVGDEFCMMTKWKREDLVGKRRFMFELMEPKSLVDYYESFGEHAFENAAQQTVMSSCVLLTPQNRKVPCAFCFTIKRDLFGLPSLVIGQFLPKSTPPSTFSSRPRKASKSASTSATHTNSVHA